MRIITTKCDGWCQVILTKLKVRSQCLEFANTMFLNVKRFHRFAAKNANSFCANFRCYFNHRPKSTVTQASSSDGPGESQNKIDKNSSIVWNPCNIQMIPDSLHSRIFIDSFRQTQFDESLIQKCRNHLEVHSLWGQQVKPVPDIGNILIPELQGEDINDHFRNIALKQTFRYKKLSDQFRASSIPDKPKEWMFKEGWTKYIKDGSAVSVPFPEEDAMVFDVEVCVPVGNAPTMACALTNESWYSWCSSTLISGEGSSAQSKYSLNDLIPLETFPGESKVPIDCLKEKIVIGHNVSYDRARIKEQYFLSGSKTRFIDTMSLHIAISGITSYQRALKITAKSGMKTVDQSQFRKFGVESNFLEWNDQSSLNNLADVYKLYCDKKLDKESRKIFVKGSLDDVRREFQSLLLYCANDVEATRRVYNELLPMFYERFPHPVTLAGMLEMGTTYLPINSNWKKYTDSSEKVFDECEMTVKSILMQKADEALKLLDDERYKDDPWLWDLDWNVPKRRKSKNTTSAETQPTYPAWYRKLLYKKTDADYMPGPAKISTSMQIVPKLLRLTWLGFPLHYTRKGGWGFLIENSTEIAPFTSAHASEIANQEMDENDTESGVNEEMPSQSFPHSEWLKIWETAKSRILNKSPFPNSKNSPAEMTRRELLNKTEQSTELKDFIQCLETLNSKGVWSKNSKKRKKDENMVNHSPHPKCLFIPLPHKDGQSNRVGNPLAKDFLAKIEEGILTSYDDSEVANKVVRLSKMTSYWRNNRDRILGQMTVWFNKSESSEFVDDDITEDEKYGAIIPQVAVSGTLTRRAVEPTWMTASNAYEDRIGSELKGMIQAPPHCYFVGADVDSQELWIASVIGDASFSGIHGSTALGWMTLQGNKSTGTDMHSKTASLIGMGRDQAKVLNYARIYGAGVSFAERLVAQFNKELTSVQAKSKAKAMYKMTKGERKYLLNEQGQRLCDTIEQLHNKKYEPFSKTELRYLMEYHDFPPSSYMELVDRLVWDGGTESHMFNRLEAIAQQERPRTPFLGCNISRSLVPSVVHKDFMTSRVNWVVQSSAVDYLHLMITCMRWLIEKYNINARFAISVHDEVRYIVSAEDRYRVALALQITNLLTRSFCAHQLDMKDLPMSVAFFSCIDIDKVLRKEVTQDCITPSNPGGLQNGYGIPLGEGLTINDLLQRTNGFLEKKLE